MGKRSDGWAPEPGAIEMGDAARRLGWEPEIGAKVWARSPYAETGTWRAGVVTQVYEPPNDRMGAYRTVLATQQIAILRLEHVVPRSAPCSHLSAAERAQW